MERKRLSDILRNGAGNNIRDLWQATEAAKDLAPLPAGEYVAHVISAEFFTAKTNNTPGVKLTFRILDGEHAGRLLWDDLWLTPDALPITKRDLAKLAATSLEQLERPLPPGIRCSVKVALRKGDDGTEFNRVKSFEAVGIDTPAADPFAPAEQQSEVSDPTAATSGDVF